MDQLLENLGFTADPFEYTDADREDRLKDYFVPPPYFDSVIGDPSQPVSTVVFAPRGSGKSAQRRTIEDIAAGEGRFLCVAYDEFDQPAGFEPTQASWDYHVRQVIRGMLIRVLIAVEEEPDRLADLAETDKEIFSALTKEFLEDLTAEQYRLAMQSVRSLRERVERFWQKFGGPLGLIVTALLKKLELPVEGIPNRLVPTSDDAANVNHRVALQQLARIAKLLGFESTYVLVDRVDELSSTTNNVQNSFNLIRSLLLDLATLETEGLAFKFFLWDELRTPYQQGGARPDRVREYILRWRFNELEEMLAKRLAAYSSGNIDSFNSLLSESVQYDAHRLVARLAAGSPRDMIRICSRVVAEASRSGEAGEPVSQAALLRGIWEFCRERAQELCNLAEISRAKSFHFTINHLASDVFRVNRQSMKSRVDRWVETGVVAKIGTESTEREGRPRDLYGITDVRVGLASRPFEEFRLLLEAAVLICPACQEVFLAEGKRILCARCGAEPAYSDCELVVAG